MVGWKTLHWWRNTRFQKKLMRNVMVKFWRKLILFVWREKAFGWKYLFTMFKGELVKLKTWNHVIDLNNLKFSYFYHFIFFLSVSGTFRKFKGRLASQNPSALGNKVSSCVFVLFTLVVRIALHYVKVSLFKLTNLCLL